jgi:uncharacterized protein YbaR (Trm112 family)
MTAPQPRRKRMLFQRWYIVRMKKNEMRSVVCRNCQRAYPTEGPKAVPGIEDKNACPECKHPTQYINTQRLNQDDVTSLETFTVTLRGRKKNNGTP